ncbi:MAG: hypothetical protein ACP5PQ_02880 [Thermoproteota archaeon]
MKTGLLKGLAFLLTVILLTVPVYIVLLSPQAEYVYYGVVPGRIYQYTPVVETDLSKGWRLIPASVADHGYLSIVASQDGTQVRVYTLPDKTLVSEATLNSMQKHYVRLSNGTMFKIVSSKLVSVLLMSPPPGGGVPGVNATEGPIATGFYSSVEGSYVGREFVIEASQGHLGFAGHIFALEKAEVTLTDEDGETQSYTLEANSYQRIQFKPLKTYRVKSTGNIMIQSGATDETGYIMRRSFFIPCAEGGFVGNRFYSKAIGTYDVTEENLFVISALEDTKVTVWDLGNKKILLEFNVKAGEPVSFKPKAYAIAVDSDKPITLQFLHSGSIKSSSGTAYGIGFSYMGVRPNEVTPLVLPTNSTIYAYIFTDEEANVIVDDVPLTIMPDEPFILSAPGLHTVYSNRNLILLLLHYPLIPEGQGINGFGVTIPCLETVNFNPAIILSPISGEGFNLPVNHVMMLVILVAIIIVIMVIVMLRRRK